MFIFLTKFWAEQGASYPQTVHVKWPLASIAQDSDLKICVFYGLARKNSLKFLQRFLLKEWQILEEFFVLCLSVCVSMLGRAVLETDGGPATLSTLEKKTKTRFGSERTCDTFGCAGFHPRCFSPINWHRGRCRPDGLLLQPYHIQRTQSRSLLTCRIGALSWLLVSTL